MGESQCDVCGHIVTGFEDREFAIKQRLLDEMAELAKLAADRCVSSEAIGMRVRSFFASTPQLTRN